MSEIDKIIDKLVDEDIIKDKRESICNFILSLENERIMKDI